MGNFESKSNLRKELKERLKRLSEREKETASLQIQTRLFRWVDLYRKIKRKNRLHLFIYVSKKEEVDTHPIIKEWLKTDCLWVPRMCGDQLAAAQIHSFVDLTKGRFHILEPLSSLPSLSNLDLLDLLVIPGLGFDKNGNRLGRGKGYFDSFLKSIGSHTLTLGLSYDAQLVESIPMEHQDKPVHYVVTPGKIFPSEELPRDFLKEKPHLK